MFAENRMEEDAYVKHFTLRILSNNNVTAVCLCLFIDLQVEWKTSRQKIRYNADSLCSLPSEMYINIFAKLKATSLLKKTNKHPT